MFANLGWEHLLLLVLAGLIILGPERLPGAIRWSAETLRRGREYLSASTGELRAEFGPEFADLRQPLRELQRLRGITPREALTRHLLDGDEHLLTDLFDTAPEASTPSGAGAVDAPDATGRPSSSTPFDSDAT